ncbi:RagB/SusD family nutrient uptake outer membrane protein [Pontibacter korlensis]
MLVFSSCEKDYLETQPTDAVSEQSVFTTTANAWAALNGIHRAMFIQYDNQDQAGHGSVLINMEMLGEDVVMTAAGNGWFNSTYKWLTHRNANAGTVRFAYRFYYKLIANANMIINNIDKVDGPDADKKEIKGQALAYRAWAHHQLVQLFAERYDASKGTNNQLGVPVLTTNTTEGQPRASVEAVYTQINADLDEAISLLPQGRNAKSHFNIDVAKGLKARVALTMGDWATAAQYANEARQAYALMSQEDYLAGFSNVENKEWMWGSDQIADQTTYFYSFFAYMSVNFSSTNIRTNPKAINNKLYAEIADTDVRKQLWDPQPTAVKDAEGKTTGYDVNGYTIPSTFSPKPYMNRKFQADGNASSIGDVPYMRAAEMYLIEAEALARLGRDGDAAAVLAELVQARDEEYTVDVTGQDLINEVLVQRRIELWGEGFRFFDLKRTNSALNRLETNHNATLVDNLFEVPAGDKRWQWVIPQDELNANRNPGMVQNPL